MPLSPSNLVDAFKCTPLFMERKWLDNFELEGRWGKRSLFLLDLHLESKTRLCCVCLDVSGNDLINGKLKNVSFFWRKNGQSVLWIKLNFDFRFDAVIHTILPSEVTEKISNYLSTLKVGLDSILWGSFLQHIKQWSARWVLVMKAIEMPCSLHVHTVVTQLFLLAPFVVTEDAIVISHCSFYGLKDA